MEKNQGSSRAKWAFVFACETALVVTIMVLIVLFSVPEERKLMDTVRDLYHAKEVKYSQYKEKSNVFTLMNLDERLKGNQDMQRTLWDDVELRFMYHDINSEFELTITDLHFSSHSEAREYFYTLPTTTSFIENDEYTLLDWRENKDARVTELACRRQSKSTNREDFKSYIVYLESKSVVLISYSTKQALVDKDRQRIEELCSALSLPNPLDQDDTLTEKQEEKSRIDDYAWVV